MNRTRLFFRVLAAALLLHAPAPACLAAAKHVIICIADGGGFNAYNAASYYQYGRLGCQPYDGPDWVKLASRTYSLTTTGRTVADDTDPMSSSGSGEMIKPASKIPFEPASVWESRIDLVNTMSLAGGASARAYVLLRQSPTDSAAAATAMASGVKAINGRLNYVPDGMGYESPLMGKSISEIAKSLGKSAGVVTTVQWNDATPAGLGGAHDVGRQNRREISNEMLTAGTLDVIMGAGHPEYDRNGAPVQPQKESDYDIAGGSFTWNLLKTGTHSRGWKMIETRAQFEALMSGPTPSRVFGLVRALGATQHERQTRDWNGDGRVDAADVRVAPPFKDPFLPNSPSLATMARGAINVLSKNPKGFFLMVEGGAVDHAAHANQPGRLIEEQIDFNNAIKAIIQWVEQHSSWDETLLIITADHETGLLWGSNSDKLLFDRMLPRGSGRAPGMWFNTGGHSNSLVPLRARGAGASFLTTRILGADPVYGQYVDNTSIFEAMQAAIGAPSTGGYTNGGASGTGGGYNSGPSDGSEFLAPSYPSTPSHPAAPAKKKPSRSKKPSTQPTDSTKTPSEMKD